MELPRIDTANLLDKTYTILKEQIVHRKFKPKEKLSIPDLADQLGDRDVLHARPEFLQDAEMHEDVCRISLAILKPRQ